MTSFCLGIWGFATASHHTVIPRIEKQQLLDRDSEVMHLKLYQPVASLVQKKLNHYLLSIMIPSSLTLGTIMNTLPALIIGYLILHNILIPLPPFQPGEEIMKIVKNRRRGPEGLFLQLSSLLVGKLVDAAVNYQERDYYFFKIVTVPINKRDRLHWIGILGHYYFYKRETISTEEDS